MKDFKLYIVEDYNTFKHIDYYNQYKEYIEIINTTKSVYPFINIFHLNYFLCEFTAFWYIWRNQIYSKYIGFCHYKRLIRLDEVFKLNKFDYISGDRTSWYQGVFFPILHSSSFEDLFNIYLQEYDNSLFDFYKYIGHKVNGRGIFIIQYETFNKMCEFMFGFIDKLLNGKSWSVQTFIHLINNEISRNINNSFSKYTKFDYNDYNIYRMFAFILEYMSGLYLEYDCIKNNKIKYYIQTPEYLY